MPRSCVYHIVLLLVFIFLIGCSYRPDELAEPLRITVLTQAPRALACASSCVVGDRLYLYGGRDHNPANQNDSLYQFDTMDSVWTAIATPIHSRIHAAMTTDGRRLYMGLGFTNGKAQQDSCYLQDWWSYDPQNDTWTALAPYPARSTNKAVVGYYQDTIYVLFGSTNGINSDCYAYSVTADTWTCLDGRNTPSKRLSTIGAIYEDKAYLGLGFDGLNLNDWYSCSLQEGVWSRHADIPSQGRVLCACTATSQGVYVFGGRHFGGDMTTGKVYNDIMVYLYDSHSWATGGAMPCGKAENMVAFTLHDTPCFGLGESPDGTLLQTIYKIEN